MTLQAPQTPCSQPICVPVSPQCVAQEVGEMQARLHRGRDRPAVQRERDVVPLRHAPPAPCMSFNTRFSSTRRLLPLGVAAALMVVDRVHVPGDVMRHLGQRAFGQCPCRA